MQLPATDDRDAGTCFPGAAQNRFLVSVFFFVDVRQCSDGLRDFVESLDVTSDDRLAGYGVFLERWRAVVSRNGDTATFTMAFDRLTAASFGLRTVISARLSLR